MITSRRAFFTGLAATLVTAPAIVRFSSLMPVRVMPTEEILQGLLTHNVDIVRVAMDHNTLYRDLARITRQQLVPRLWRQQYIQQPTMFSRWPAT